MTKRDVDAALRCGADIVHVSIPVSDLQIARKLRRDRACVLAEIAHWLQHLAEQGAVVSVGFEDASRMRPGASEPTKPA